jgi:hypothetical protein
MFIRQSALNPSAALSARSRSTTSSRSRLLDQFGIHLRVAPRWTGNMAVGGSGQEPARGSQPESSLDAVEDAEIED